MIIQLTQCFEAVIDEADASLVEGFTWRVIECGRHRKRFYAIAHMLRDDRPSSVLMHSVITGWPFVDHIDCDGLNNQRSNLRPSNVVLNGRNRRPNVGGSSIYKGVSWHKSHDMWQARITVKGKTIHLGHFHDELTAAMVYDVEAAALFGDHARLNFGGVQDHHSPV